METRLVPDAPGAWLVYDLGELVFAVPPELRAAADAIAANPPGGIAAMLAVLTSMGVGGASFAVLDAAAEGLHVALRGTATLAAGAETLTGLGAEPWLERFIPGASVVRLTVPGGEWTVTLAAPSAPEGGGGPKDVPHITEVPDYESSLPRVAPTPPPSLGLAAAAVPAPQPPARALSLELPDGTREPLDDVVVLGRAPTVPVGRVVRLAGDGDISRNHAKVAVEGGTVIVTDLGSRNGTIVRIPGHPAQRLREGEPTPVLVGTTIDFGGGLKLNVRED